MADQLNDMQMRALGNEGYIGSLNDRMIQWLKFEGAIGDALNDLWLSYLSAEPSSQINDKAFTWLTGLGYNQPNLADKQLQYWTDRANV